MIPQRVFQTLALLAVIGCLFVTFAYAMSGGWPFPAIVAASGSNVLGALVTLLVALLVSLVFIVPLRLMSDMKPITDELSDVSLEAITRERAKLEAMRRGSPDERRTYHHRMAAASFAGLFVGAPILYATHEVKAETIFLFPVALVIYGVFGPPVHLLIAYFAGRGRP